MLYAAPVDDAHITIDTRTNSGLYAAKVRIRPMLLTR
jgi:hypothetical protein